MTEIDLSEMQESVPSWAKWDADGVTIHLDLQRYNKLVSALVEAENAVAHRITKPGEVITEKRQADLLLLGGLGGFRHGLEAAGFCFRVAKGA